MELGEEFARIVRCERGGTHMKSIRFVLICGLIGLGIWFAPADLCAQDAKSSGEKQADKSQPSSADANGGHAYSGMYSFLKDGEFVQLTVEDGGSVTGFVSRFGDGDSDKGAFLDQFFKTGKLEGNKLSFTTEVVHGVAFDFHGSVERGEGKSPSDEAYFVLKGTLTENISDANKKVTSRPRPVVFKMFPQESSPAPVVRN
jgi:hypothetical protein